MVCLLLLHCSLLSNNPIIFFSFLVFPTHSLRSSQYWYDYKLKWDAEEYGGVNMLHVPSDHIWRPDIVLYNK